MRATSVPSAAHRSFPQPTISLDFRRPTSAWLWQVEGRRSVKYADAREQQLPRTSTSAQASGSVTAKVQHWPPPCSPAPIDCTAEVFGTGTYQ